MLLPGSVGIQTVRDGRAYASEGEQQVDCPAPAAPGASSPGAESPEPVHRDIARTLPTGGVSMLAITPQMTGLAISPDITISGLGQQLINVASSASIYALVAVGLTIVFGLSRIVNIAAGDFLTVGAFAIFLVNGGGANFIWALPFAAVVVGALGFITERLLFRFTLSRPISGFLIGLGLVQIIENGLAFRYTYPVSLQPISSAIWTIGQVRITADEVIVMGGTLIILTALELYLNHTRQGAAIQAVSSDSEAAALMGIPVSRIIAGVFALGGLLAGAGGAFIATLQPITPYLGSELILKGFVVALLGGLGNVRGALMGAVVLAIIEAFLAVLGFSAWIDPIEFGVVVLLLLYRPLGLAGGLEHSMG